MDRLVQEITQAKSDRKHYETRRLTIVSEIETVAKQVAHLEEELKVL